PNKTDYQFWKLDLKGDLAYTLFTLEGLKGRGFRPGLFWLKKEKPIDNVAKIQIPILYIHGEKDWVIKPWHSQALYDKTQSKKRLVIIKKGPHAEYLTRDYFEQFMTEVKTWFKDTL
ncbi:MAG: alpha/beta hydrolase, partial [Atribacterota bacterium]|nr:alpha/beta hydrolase [Atribacterota bacterium]